MKSAEALQNALRIKEKELEVQRTKVESIQTYIDGITFFKNEDPTKYAEKIAFLEKCLTEKIETKPRLIQLEEQVKFLRWILEV